MIKNLTPKGIAIRVSFLVVIFITAVLFLSQLLTDNINWVTIGIVFPTTFVLSYFIFLNTIERFIYSKIKLIYRTIHNLKLKKSDTGNKDFSMDVDILSQVRQDVIEWDRTNKQEIERLKGMEEYRREFVGNVSHELKTPIFSIQGYLMTLMEGGLHDENINENYLKKANKGVDRMIDIIDDLDEITKLESGVIEMDLKKVSILKLAQEMVSSLEINAAEKNIKLSVENYTNDSNVWVNADEAKISQVLVNLIINSIKYGVDDGHSKVKLYDLDENILIEVSDNGQGIPEEHHSRLFERFYRTDKARTRDAGGSGLGLSIVKHIIEAHEQTINVRSTVGVGSTFSFTLKKYSNK